MHGSSEEAHSFNQLHHRIFPVTLPLTNKTGICPPSIPVVWHSPAAVSLSLPPTATPRLTRIFRGEQWCSTETKITLHSEKASRAQHQVAEAVHLKTKYDLLTAIPETRGRCNGPEHMLYVMVCFFVFYCSCSVYFFSWCCFDPIRPFNCMSSTEICLYSAAKNKILSIMHTVYL